MAILHMSQTLRWMVLYLYDAVWHVAYTVGDRRGPVDSILPSCSMRILVVGRNFHSSLAVGETTSVMPLSSCTM